MYLVTFFCIFAVKLSQVNGAYTQSLSGWWLLSSYKPVPDGCQVWIPGDIYSGLQDAGVIGNPLYRYGDAQTRWVASRDFTLLKSFQADPKLLKEDAIDLVLESVDTIAELQLGTVSLGTKQSMFLPTVVDVTRILKTQTSGALNLSITLRSPVLAAKSRVAKDTPLASPPLCPPDSYHGECFVNQLRKQQSSFAWDWGPAIPTSGIYGSVYLIGYSVKVLYLSVSTTVIDSPTPSWSFLVRVWLQSTSEASVTLLFNVPGFYNAPLSVRLPKGVSDYAVSWVSAVRANKLWWPHGYGAQPLFPATVSVQSASGSTLDTASIFFGIRQIQLIQNQLSNGLSFYFSVNGRPVYARGSNWVPLDSVVGNNVTSRNARIDALLNAVVEANQNMIRVWGGGLYESDYFYEKCDQLGILIWQDFMFACALYPHPRSPVSHDFYEAVRGEAEHQILRLMHHPSIAIWAGNNENEAALSQNWYNSANNYSYFYEAYIYLYINTLRNITVRLDPNRPFVSSSPSNGKETEKEGWVAKNPYDIRFGDLHFYQYNGELWKYAYPKSRFVSEYGFQSLASLETWLLATDPDVDWSWDAVTGNTSDVINWREHLPSGLTYLLKSIDQHFDWKAAKLPKATLSVVLKRDQSLVTNAQQRFGAFVYLSQLEQTEIIAAQTRVYRAASRCDLDAVGGGYNMGSMYWQLNDVWHTVSWSSVDYTLRRKPLHYAMTRLFEQEAIFFQSEVEGGDRKLTIYYVNEELVTSDAQLCISSRQQAPARRLTLRCHYLDNVMPQYEVRYDLANYTLAYQFTNAIVSSLEESYLFDCSCIAADKCGLHAVLSNEDGTEVISEDFYLFGFPKVMKLVQANVVIDSVSYAETNRLGNNSYFDYTVVVSTDMPALYVCLDSHHIVGYFSDNNCLHLFDSTRQLQFHSTENVTLDTLRAQLTVTSLTDLHREGDGNRRVFMKPEAVDKSMNTANREIDESRLL